MNTEDELLATLKSINETLKNIEILLQNNKSDEIYKKYGINRTFA